MHNPPAGRRASLPDPALMSPAARRAEVAAILATGFLRLRLKHVDGGEQDLDVLRPRRHTPEKETAPGGAAQRSPPMAE